VKKFTEETINLIYSKDWSWFRNGFNNYKARMFVRGL